MDIDVGGGDDPRTGSAREDSDDGGTLSKLGGAGNSSSLLSTISTLVPVLVFASVCLILFWIFRRSIFRVYSPRAILRRLYPQEKLSTPSKGWFDWVKPFFRQDDVHVLNHSSLDAYLFLRYLKVLSFICFVGCCLMWPSLMPVHATGGGGLSQLDSITIGNVTDENLFYVHVVVSWIFFGFILFVIYRECIYYINLRHAYLLAPSYAKRLSSRTVLFQCVPEKYLDAHRLRKVFGETVKHIWIQRDTTDLQHLVEEREETAVRLEQAETRLIKIADVARKRGQRSAPPQPKHSHRRPPSPSPMTTSATASPATTEATTATTATATATVESSSPASSSCSINSTAATAVTSPSEPKPLDDPEKDLGLPHPSTETSGSVAAQWIPANHRPGHRPLGNFFRRVDTIKWTRTRLRALNPQISKMRRKLHTGDEGRLLSAVFVEFETQSDAQRAYQTLAHDKPLHMSPRHVGIRPDEVVWSSLRIGWFSRMIRRVAMLAFIVAAIIFWAIPSAIVGTMSNVSTLAEMFVFLRWLEELPEVILGVIQGFVPALALTLLMAIVPWMLRGCARVAGEPSLSEIELYVQNFYFAFQVVQVFLVTTLTSAASAALTDVLQDPLSAPDLLSENLPKASNFYLSYILIQCLAVGATSLLRLWDLIKHGVIAKSIQRPRSLWRIHKFTRPVHWGGLFPIFTNMGVIAISYSCIAPVILGFAAVGLYVMYLVNKYNFLYVEDSSIDTRGLVYPRALKHLLFGLYLAEICLIGLFALRTAFAPMLLTIIFLIFTVIFHISLTEALSPLLANLPRTLALENEELMNEGKEPPNSTSVDPAAVPLPPADDDDEDDDADDVAHETHGNRSFFRSIGTEGTPSLAKIISKFSWEAYVGALTGMLRAIGLGPVLERVDAVTHPAYRPDPNPVMRFFHPSTFDSFAHLRSLVPSDLPDPTDSYSEDYVYRTYYPPEMWTPPPKIWLPRDEAGVSVQEVEHCLRFGKTTATDEGAWLDGKSRIQCEVDKAPYWEEKVLY